MSVGRADAGTYSGLEAGVVFFDPYPHSLGGAQIVTLAAASGLRSRGIEARIITTDDGALTEASEKARIPVSVVRVPGALTIYGHATVGTARIWAAAALPVAWSRVAQQLTPRPAIVHAIDLRGTLLAGPPARTLRIPVVSHLHLSEPEPTLNRIAGLFANAVLTPSRQALSVLPGPVMRKGRVLHNGVRDDVLDAPQARFERPLVVTAARISEQKGIDILAEATSLVTRRVPDVQVRVFGDVQRGWERYHTGILQRLNALGLGQCFELAGFIENPAQQWAEASVYVQPSRHEGLPLSVVEAMAVGLPVVASAVGGLAEIVEDETTGLLVPPENPEALAEAIIDLLLDPARSRRMGEAGRERVSQLYSMSSMVDRLIEVYRGLH